MAPGLSYGEAVDESGSLVHADISTSAPSRRNFDRHVERRTRDVPDVRLVDVDRHLFGASLKSKAFMKSSEEAKKSWPSTT